VAEGQTFVDHLNPDSLTTVTAKVEPALAADAVGVPLQFERHAYFVRDPDDAEGLAARPTRLGPALDLSRGRAVRPGRFVRRSRAQKREGKPRRSAAGRKRGRV